MDSDFEQLLYQHHFQSPQRQFSHQNNLTRFNSAPSSCFSSFLDEKSGENRDYFANARPLSPETERILANFVSSMSDENKESYSTPTEKDKIVYQSLSKPPLAKQSHSVSRAGVSPSSLGGSLTGSGSSSGLIRHGSSPAGFFNNIFNIDPGLLKQNSGNIKTEPYTSENQSGYGMSHHPRPLSHHLSLPKPSVEISEMEKMMELHDIVPCKISAKRGFATHPRSIAERNRRSKISERMRKLQAVVPNMNEVLHV